jgi:hypothetical protein
VIAMPFRSISNRNELIYTIDEALGTSTDDVR